MVYNKSNDIDSMPQMVPSAGFTPPCDYSAFAADSFDLSLLPGGETELPLSPSTLLYTQSPPPSEKPKIYTTFYPNSPNENLQNNNNDNNIELGPDFQKLLAPETEKRSVRSPIHLEVPNNNFYPSSPSSYCSSDYQKSLISPQYPASPCESFTLYPASPLNKSEENLSFYQQNNDKFYSSELYISQELQKFNQYIKKEELNYKNKENSSVYNFQIKEEGFLSPCSQSSPSSCFSYSNHSSPINPTAFLKDNSIPILEEAFFETNFTEKPIKQESTVDFGDLLQNLDVKPILDNDFKKPFANQDTISIKKKSKETNQDHKLLRQVLGDTSFQKKYNLKPIDFGLGTGFVGNTTSIKMEEPEIEEMEQMASEELARERMEPVFEHLIEQIGKDVDNTCNVLGISQDPRQWSCEDVKSWVRWTSQQYQLPQVQPDVFALTGQELTQLTEEQFTERAPESGSILHAQLEIWKAACCQEELMPWTPTATTTISNQSSNASSIGDETDDDEDETSSQTSKPSSSRGTGSHIHLWQFLKELLANPQTHGSCIRWLDRQKGVFKIEDSVRVAKLWGKRKNRLAMNYDKLSRSIRQYYKKGIMKKTERSQRLVYQFCHPYSL